MMLRLTSVRQQETREILKIYEALEELRREYPDFRHWYFHSVVPGLADGSRSILLLKDGIKNAGILIAKDDGREKKLCTLRVHPQYRGLGGGRLLLAAAQELLGTSKPLVTVSEDHLFEFRSLFQRQGYRLWGIYRDCYRPGCREYSFNGPLCSKAPVLPCRLLRKGCA